MRDFVRDLGSDKTRLEDELKAVNRDLAKQAGTPAQAALANALEKVVYTQGIAEATAERLQDLRETVQDMRGH